MNLDMLYVAAGAYALQQYARQKAPTITQPANGATLKFSSFPAQITVTGNAPMPATLSLYTVGDVFIDGENVTGTFSASLDVEGPGPHELRVTYKDTSGNTISNTIMLLIQDTSITPPPTWNFASLHGVNFITSKMRWREAWAQPDNHGIQTNQIPQFVKLCKDSGFNFLRLVGYMEVWQAHHAEYMNEIVDVCRACEDEGIYVFLDHLHQWKFGAGIYSESVGFPSSFKQGYTITGAISTYEEPTVDPDMVALWHDLWLNQLRGGLNAHNAIMEYNSEIIELTKAFRSVVGYEGINEPQVTSQHIVDYTGMGVLNTKLNGQVLQQAPGKLFFVCRDNGIGATQPNNRERWRMFPTNAPNLVYDSHRYDPDMAQYITQTNNVLNDFKSKAAGAIPFKVCVGEWRPVTRKRDGQGNLINQYLTVPELVPKMKNWLVPCKQQGYSSTYWAYGGYQFAMDGVLVRNPGSDPIGENLLTNPGLALKQAIAEVYP